MDELKTMQQDILKKIYYHNMNEGKARVTDIAEETGLSKSRVNQEVKKLISYGLVVDEKYCPLKLTGLGEFEAKKVLFTHIVVKRYLIEYLDLDEETAEQDSCAIEHIISNEALLGMLDKIKDTNKEIFGCPIESVAKFIEKKFRMSSMKINEVGQIIKVEGDLKNKKRLMEMGIIKGERVQLIGVAPFNDPMKFQIGDYDLTLRKKEADFIIIEKED